MKNLKTLLTSITCSTDVKNTHYLKKIPPHFVLTSVEHLNDVKSSLYSLFYTSGWELKPLFLLARR